MRAAIYARYSDPRQNPDSIRDQVAVCRALIAHEGYLEVAVYSDAAISAAAPGNRPGYLQMLADARTGAFDVVVGEALDRLSRGQADVTNTYEDLQALGVEIHTLAEGRITELHIGLKGTMNALALKDLGAKTHRGMAGVLREGRAISTPYGYRVVRKLDAAGELVVGLREIDEFERAIVLRIFDEYASGKSPRMICSGLNAEAIPSPTGKAWAANRLTGRRYGLLTNEAYRGVLVWGKSRGVKDRSTGRKRQVVSAPEAVIRIERPDLRIVDDLLWARVQARLAANAAASPADAQARRRPKRLLSGVIACGCCGSAMTASHNAKAARYRCNGRVNKGPAFCTNGGTVPAADAERRVLAAVRDRLLRPEMIEAVVREVHRLSAERARTSGADRGRLERELGEVRRKAERLVDQVAEGVLAGSTVAGKIRELEARATILEREIQDTNAASNVVAMHPAAGDHYRRLVDDLSAALDSEVPAEVSAREAFRALIGKVRMIPGNKRGVYDLEIATPMQRLMTFIAGDRAFPAAGDIMPDLRILA